MNVIDDAAQSGFITVNNCRLEYLKIGSSPLGAPTLVFLHEGLGCVAMWRNFPARVARETGLGCLVFSRQGYGGSDPIPVPRPVSYMHHEGLDVLPQVLAEMKIEHAILVGHSDGGSIALIHAGSGVAGRVMAVVTIAAHVFNEDISVASIEAAKVAFETTDLPIKLAKYHGDNVDGAFWGWNRVWLDPEFRHWNIEEYLSGVTVPAFVIQGSEDQYGTMAQVEAITSQVSGPVDRLIVLGCHHSPHLEESDVVARGIARFIEAL